MVGKGSGDCKQALVLDLAPAYLMCRQQQPTATDTSCLAAVSAMFCLLSACMWVRIMHRDIECVADLANRPICFLPFCQQVPVPENKTRLFYDSNYKCPGVGVV